MDVTRAVILLVVAVVLGVILLQAATRRPAPATSAVSTTSRVATTTAPTTTTTTVAHASVAVLVANGTTQQNVAAHFTQVLKAQGWNTQAPADTTTAATASNVYYAAGQQNAANEVATELGLEPTAVKPLTTAVPVTSTAGVDVVAVIGPDLAGTGFPAPPAT